MPRIHLKGLLIKDVDDVYQQVIQSSFERSGLTREQFAEKLEKQITEVSDAFDKVLVKEYSKNFTVKLSFFHNGILKVEKAIAKKFSKPFQFYFSYLSTCHHIMKNLLDSIASMEHNQTDTVVVGLFGELLRRADQIGILLLNGYNDAALILWRSYYEYALTLKLIADKDDNMLSIRFMQHNVRHAKRLGESYSTRLVKEGFDALNDQDILAISEEYKKLEQEYGKEFISNEFGWADGLLTTGKRITIKDIEEMVGMGKFRPYYIWASAYSHPNYEVFKKVTRDDKFYVGEIKEVAPDLEDMIDPMQITLAVLQQSAESLLELICDENEIGINTELLLSMYMQLIESFDN